jgi:hypothetical protein
MGEIKGLEELINSRVSVEYKQSTEKEIDEWLNSLIPNHTQKEDVAFISRGLYEYLKTLK